MNYQNSINTALIKNRYIFLVLFFISCYFLYVRGLLNYGVSASSFLCLVTLLISNNKLNEYNKGSVAILHMIVIVLMVATGQYLLGSNEKYILLLNSANAFLISGSIYGFYISYKNREDY